MSFDLDEPDPDPQAPTRESWLLDAYSRLNEVFPPGAADSQPPVKISVGLPRGGRKVRGQAWFPERSADGKTVHIFISPELTDTLDVLTVLLHEKVHAVVGPEKKHTKPFQTLAAKVGLLAPFTGSNPSEGLLERLRELQGGMGGYPHVGLTPSFKEKQTTRMRLYECPEGIKIRHAGDTLNARCEDCGELFTQVKKEEV